MRRLDIDLMISNPNVNDNQVVKFAVVNKPKSEGVGVSADITDEQWSVKPRMCMTGTLSTTGATDIDRMAAIVFTTF